MRGPNQGRVESGSLVRAGRRGGRATNVAVWANAAQVSRLETEHWPLGLAVRSSKGVSDC